MEVMILVRLEVVLPATVRGCWADQKMNSIPHESKRCCVDQEGWSETAEVVKVFQGMHAKAMRAPPSRHDALATDADNVIKICQDGFVRVRKSFENLTTQFGEQYAKEINEFLEAHPDNVALQLQMKLIDLRFARVSNLTRRLRDEASFKTERELEKLLGNMIKVFRYNQQVKGLTKEELFDAIDTNGDGEIDFAELAEWFESADKDIRELDYKEPVGELAATNGLASPVSEGEKNGSGATKASASTKSEKPAETMDFTMETLERVFPALLDEGHTSSTWSREVFFKHVQLFYKVVKETTVTNHHSIKVGKPHRKLDMNEVLEVLDGPFKEEMARVTRVRCRAVRDGVEGWVTVGTSLGTEFLREGCSKFQVMKDTMLSAGLTLGDQPDANARPRKLAAG